MIRPARPQKPHRLLQLFLVVLDVLENINVDDGVELAFLQRLQCAANNFAARLELRFFEVR